MKKIAAFILLAMHVHGAFALQATPPSIPPKIQEFIKLLEGEVGDLQGGAIAILHKGKVIYKTTFGHSQGQTGMITSKTLFPLASVSKSVAATALALLVNDGQVDLSQKYTLPCLKSKIHLKHVLSHTTGVPFSGNPLIEQGKNREELLLKLKSQPEACQPGGCYFYSNTTFSLLEELLNQRNLSLDDAIKKLQSTLKTDGIQILPLKSDRDIAYPHRQTKDKNGRRFINQLPFPPYYPKVVPASAGIFASLDGMIDLLKLQSGYRPDLISQETLDQFYEPITISKDILRWEKYLSFRVEDTESYYGLGFRIIRSKKIPDKDFIYHCGSIAGISTAFGFMPAEEVGIIILLNQNSKFALHKLFAFWTLFLE